jgi:hypothetical protein
MDSSLQTSDQKMVSGMESSNFHSEKKKFKAIPSAGEVMATVFRMQNR